MNNWDDIRFFLAVARTGSVTAAARQLGVNHSTVSRRIHALEDKHGVRLFERVSDGYSMTLASESIYETAVELEKSNQHIERQLFGQDSRLQGDISLTMPHDILNHCLIDDVHSFLQNYPEIKLDLQVQKGLRNLAAREADIAIRLTNSPPDYLIGQEVARLQHGIYAHHNLIAETDQSQLSTAIITWHGENKLPDWAKLLPNPRIVMQVDDLFSMYQAVTRGIGYARMPCYMPDSLNNPHITRLNVQLPASDWGVWLLSHVDLRNTARIRTCREFLLSQLLLKKDLFEGKVSQPKP